MSLMAVLTLDSAIVVGRKPEAKELSISYDLPLTPAHSAADLSEMVHPGKGSPEGNSSDEAPRF